MERDSNTQDVKVGHTPKWIKRDIVLAFGIAVASAVANAQMIVVSSSAPESITVTVNNGSAVNFMLAPSAPANAASVTTSFTATWVLKPGRTSVAMWAYFDNATVALRHQTAGNTTDISPAMFKIQVDGAGPFASVTTVNPFNGLPSGLQIGPSIRITGANKAGSSTHTLAYQIDTTLQPQLEADTYAGALNLQVQATP